MTTEKVFQFGEQQQLFGIVTEPSATLQTKPAVLLLNAGLVHRVGPYRMAVILARRLADLGYLVFRFDLSNIGDSANNRDTDDYRRRTEKEIRAAQDIVTEKYSINQFIAMGLCTGAMNAHVITVADKRIVGAVLLDAYAYPTMKSLINRYKSKLRKMLDRALFRRLTKKLTYSRHQENETIGEGIDYWVFPPKEEVEKELSELIQRQVELLFVYAGSFEYFYNYPEQLQDNFPSIDFRDQVSVHILKDSDHMYTLYEDTEILLQLIIDWVSKKFH